MLPVFSQLIITTDMRDRDGTVISFNCSISSNIPTGLLVDCCCESVQQFFRRSYFSAGIQQSIKFLSGEGAPAATGGGTTMATRMGPCRGAAGTEGWVRSRGGGYAITQHELITLSK